MEEHHMDIHTGMDRWVVEEEGSVKEASVVGWRSFIKDQYGTKEEDIGLEIEVVEWGNRDRQKHTLDDDIYEMPSKKTSSNNDRGSQNVVEIGHWSSR